MEDRIAFIYKFVAITFIIGTGSGALSGLNDRRNLDLEKSAEWLIDEIDRQLINGRPQIHEHSCYENHLKPNLHRTIEALKLYGDEFIDRTPYLLEVTLNAGLEGRPNEFMVMLKWISSVQDFSGIRVVELWDLEGEGIGVIDEEYRMFSEDEDYSFYGKTPLHLWGLWMTPRESFDVRKDESEWEKVRERKDKEWPLDLPELFIGDPRKGVKVFVSMIDTMGRESRWFPVECVLSSENL